MQKLSGFAALLLLTSLVEGQTIDALHQLKNLHYYDVKTAGAKGDGTTDDAAAINAALAARPNVVASCGTYLIASTINVPAGVTLGLTPCVSFIYSGSNATPAFIFNGPQNQNITLNVAKQTQMTWKTTDSTSIAVQFLGGNQNEIHLSAYGFWNNIDIQDGATGFYHNRVYIVDSEDSKIHLHLHNVNGNGVNQNQFIGGQLVNNSAACQSLGPSVPVPGTTYILNDAANNFASFFGTEIENACVQYSLHSYGGLNCYECRFEGNNSGAVLLESGSSGKIENPFLDSGVFSPVIINHGSSHVDSPYQEYRNFADLGTFAGILDQVATGANNATILYQRRFDVPREAMGGTFAATTFNNERYQAINPNAGGNTGVAGYISAGASQPSGGFFVDDSVSPARVYYLGNSNNGGALPDIYLGSTIGSGARADTMQLQQSLDTLALGSADGTTKIKLRGAANLVVTENGANNAIACAAGCLPTLYEGLETSIILAHSLQAGADTFAANGGSAIPIRRHTDSSANLGTAYNANGTIHVYYSAIHGVWEDMSQ